MEYISLTDNNQINNKSYNLIINKMKAIKYLTMAVAALMMAACSNDELESAASKSGGRRALEIVPIVQGQTRAAQLTTSNLTSFMVSVTGKFCEDDGTEITNPVLTLTKNGSNWGYTYLSGSAVHNGPLYWPNEATTASFSAYTHAAGAVDESTEQTDIIGGWATKDFDGSTDPGQVGLTLQHAVAKMQFKALVQGEATDTRKVKINIKQVAVRNIGYAGTYAIPTSATDNKGVLALSTSATPATTDIVSESASKGTFIEVGAAAATDLASFFMVPQTITAQDLTEDSWSNSYISILAQVRTIEGSTESRLFPAGTNATDDSYAWIALPMPTEFTGMEAHKKYIFTLNFDATHGIGKVDRDQDPDDTDTDPATDPDDNIDPNDKGKDIKLPGSSTSRVIVTVTEVNDFDEGGDIDVINTSSGGGSSASVPEGALPGEFSIGSKKVYFSKGNLQATTNDHGATWTWAFAENQWDYIGGRSQQNKGTETGNNYVNGIGTVSANGTVDLFCWVGASSTWGGAAMYGISNSGEEAYNKTDGYGTGEAEALKSDWGNTMGSGWRTPTSDEWKYIFGVNSGDKRTGSTVGSTNNGCYTFATINTDNTGVNGVILFPDGETIANNAVTSWGSINSYNASWEVCTKCTSAQWNALADKGCVFLPAAGKRQEGSYNSQVVNVTETHGYYWSSTPYYVNSCGAFYYGPNYQPIWNSENRWFAYSVRLVRDVE